MTVSLRPEAVKSRVTRVAELTREGMTAAGISSVVGISVRSVQRYRFLAGVSCEVASPLSASELSCAEALLADGCSYAEVARTLGRSWSAVAHRFPGHSWDRSECSRFAVSVRHIEERMQAVYG